MKRRQNSPRDDEQVSRYRYLVDVLPASVLDRAHAAALDTLPPEQRDRILAQAPPVDSDTAERDAASAPEALAALLRDTNADDPAPGAAAAAASVVGSPPVVAYFATGAGSVDIDQQPPWVQDLAGHDGAPLDSATTRRRALDFGEWYS